MDSRHTSASHLQSGNPRNFVGITHGQQAHYNMFCSSTIYLQNRIRLTSDVLRTAVDQRITGVL